jgi:hypothetical protein
MGKDQENQSEAREGAFLEGGREGEVRPDGIEGQEGEGVHVSLGGQEMVQRGLLNGSTGLDPRLASLACQVLLHVLTFKRVGGGLLLWRRVIIPFEMC